MTQRASCQRYAPRVAEADGTRPTATKRGYCAPLTSEHPEVLRVCAPSSGALDLILRGLVVADRQAIQGCTAAYRAAAQSCIRSISTANQNEVSAVTEHAPSSTSATEKPGVTARSCETSAGVSSNGVEAESSSSALKEHESTVLDARNQALAIPT